MDVVGSGSVGQKSNVHLEYPAKLLNLYITLQLVVILLEQKRIPIAQTYQYFNQTKFFFISRNQTLEAPENVVVFVQL